MKKCKLCKQIKPAAMFYHNYSMSDGLDYICKECRKAYSREQRKRSAKARPQPVKLKKLTKDDQMKVWNKLF